MARVDIEENSAIRLQGQTDVTSTFTAAEDRAARKPTHGAPATQTSQDRADPRGSALLLLPEGQLRSGRILGASHFRAATARAIERARR